MKLFLPKLIILILVVIITVIIFLFLNSKKEQSGPENDFRTDEQNSVLAEKINVKEATQPMLSIEIEYLQSRQYPGSQPVIEETLSPGSNYNRYIASYYSDGLKQYGLLTIPTSDPPDAGFPIIIFNHGYIDPKIYRTIERYGAYMDAFSRADYIVFKPDYRGHDKSEGEALGGYGNSDYIIDVLNAANSIKKLEQADSSKLGMWGHSMGGWITHRSMVVDPTIKVGVIWAGMVGGYDDLLELRQPYWVRQGRPEPTSDPQNPLANWRRYLVDEYGSPSENPAFWDSISAVPYLSLLSGPIQLHHAKGDESVPYTLSERFYESLKKTSPESELFIYDGDDHNISRNFSKAMLESVTFMNKQLSN